MKRILSFLIVLMLLLTACSHPVSSKVSTAEPVNQEVPAPTTPTYYPITVTDQAGREVTILREPQRLISAYYITSSLLIALDLEEQLVGIENNPEKRAIYGLSAPSFLELPQIGTAKELDLEACAALEPDLLILPMKLKNAVPTLEELGMTVLLVDPEDQQRLSTMIELVGDATNRQALAEKLLHFIDEQQKFLADALSGTETPSVYLSSNASLLRTAGDAMYQADMIRLAGGKNTANAIEDTYWAEIDYEQLLTWNPDYIILAAEATYSEEDVLSDPNLTGCTATSNKNIYRLPNTIEAWDSPVPGSFLGSFWLANVLHPDKISDTELNARIKNFYETFYHFTCTEN